MTADLVAPFMTALENSPGNLSLLAQAGRRVFGYFCTYTPIELVDACGWVPVRIAGGPGSLEKSYTRVPDFICPYMKRALEKGLNGEYDYLSGIIDGYTCDAACGVANIWADTIGGDLFRVLPLPYRDSSASRRFYREVLGERVDDLSRLGGHVCQDSLSTAIDVRERIGEMIRAFYDLRYDGCLPLNTVELWTVVQAGFTLPPETYRDLLEDLLIRVAAAPVPERPGVPVMVSGSLIESVTVPEEIEACGGRVVADDLCTGIRAFSQFSSNGEDPFERLMDRHFNRIECASRSRAEKRLVLIRNLVKRSGARGVLFVLPKFCTPHLADIPLLSKELKKAGVPALLVEMDENWQMQGAVRTRLEAFFEMLDSVC
jgi:benzoyl-CoA reductase/2-hydroxyglutaryl-CoA dehydratase subunit BcrC/BadD/HgdB